MAKVIIGHHPELTAKDVMDIFQRQFAGKYELYIPGCHALIFLLSRVPGGSQR